MCAQCWTAAATAVGGATGLRAWIATRSPSWATPARMKLLTLSLLLVAVLAASLRFS